MAGPQLTVDLESIHSNAKIITDICGEYGITVTGVTKVTCGMPQVARAMLKGGVSGIGESRLENIHRLRASGITAPVMLLRIPPLSEVDEIVSVVDVSLNSELPIIRQLSQAAEQRGIVHDIILMLDLGDLREGIWPCDLMDTVRDILPLPGIRITGIGTNLTCYGGVLPTRENMQTLVDYAHRIEDRFAVPVPTISGGNSSSLPLLFSGKMPKEINHLRLGESILLGRETAYRKKIPGTRQDAFVLSAEVIELKKKPSVPIGETGEDAFGGKPVFQDRGERRRAILNVGREDVDIEGLTPREQHIQVLGASSDHLLIDVNDAEQPLSLGSRISFLLNYGALLSTMTSAYVQKLFLSGEHTMDRIRGVHIFAPSGEFSRFAEHRLSGRIEELGIEVQQSIHDGAAERREIAAAIREGQIPFLIGSDHGVCRTGISAAGSELEGFGLLWFDSRPCFLPSPSGDQSELCGRSALYELLREIPGMEKSRMGRPLSPENVVIIGIRETLSDEAEELKNSAVTAYTMEDVDALGIREVMRQSLQRAGWGTAGIWVSFSPEVVDSLTDTEEAGGLTLRETHLAMEMIARTGLLIGVSFSDSGMQHSDRVFSKCSDFALSILGKKILG